MANGLKITVDANISTACLGTALTGGTQDQMYVVAADECHLWEDPNSPLLIRCEQPAAASLGVLLGVYGYLAFTLARYSGGSVVITEQDWLRLASRNKSSVGQRCTVVASPFRAVGAPFSVDRPDLVWLQIRHREEPVSPLNDDLLSQPRGVD
jgi:hypothetical protein